MNDPNQFLILLYKDRAVDRVTKQYWEQNKNYKFVKRELWGSQEIKDEKENNKAEK